MESVVAVKASSVISGAASVVLRSLLESRRARVKGDARRSTSLASSASGSGTGRRSTATTTASSTAALSMGERARTAFIDCGARVYLTEAARAAPKTTPSLSSSKASTGARGTLVRWAQTFKAATRIARSSFCEARRRRAAPLMLKRRRARAAQSLKPRPRPPTLMMRPLTVYERSRGPRPAARLPATGSRAPVSQRRRRATPLPFRCRGASAGPRPTRTRRGRRRRAVAWIRARPARRRAAP